MKKLKFNTNPEFISLGKFERFEKITDFYLRKIEFGVDEETVSENVNSIFALSALYPNLIHVDHWDEIIYRKWERIFSDKRAYFWGNLALYGGITEVAYVAECLNNSSGKYNGLSSQLRNYILRMMPRYIYELKRRPLAFASYDCIRGTSGIIGYLLMNPNKESVQCIDTLLEYLVDICKRDQAGLKGWVIESENMPTYDEYKKYVNGAVNFSLSHGLAGVLSAMSLVMMSGVKTIDLKPTVDYIYSRYFAGFCGVMDGIPYWPGILPSEKIEDMTGMQYSKRMSWCYGAPGIIRSIYLYACAVGNLSLKEWCYTKMEKIALLKTSECQLISPTICHGMAGLMMILEVFNKEKKSDILKGRISALFDEITSLFDRRYMWGFEDVNYIFNEKGAHKKTTSTNNFLTGSVGVMLALLGALDESECYARRLLLK